MGCSFAKILGSNPSPAIAYGNLVMDNIPASSDPAIENRAPTVMNIAPNPPKSANPANASGAFDPESDVHGTTPKSRSLL